MRRRNARRSHLHILQLSHLHIYISTYYISTYYNMWTCICGDVSATITSPYITSPHITSPPITSISSPHMTSPHIHITSPHIHISTYYISTYSYYTTRCNMWRCEYLGKRGGASLSPNHVSPVFTTHVMRDDPPRLPRYPRITSLDASSTHHIAPPHITCRYICIWV